MTDEKENAVVSLDTDSYVWELSDDFPDAEQAAQIEHDAKDFIRQLVNRQVAAAVIDYVKEGNITIDYRKGGSPIVSFHAADPLDSVSHQIDLGDLLLQELEEWKDQQGHPMRDLVWMLFKTYEEWRAKRVASDPDCDIPEPSIVTGEATDYLLSTQANARDLHDGLADAKAGRLIDYDPRTKQR